MKNKEVKILRREKNRYTRKEISCIVAGGIALIAFIATKSTEMMPEISLDPEGLKVIWESSLAYSKEVFNKLRVTPIDPEAFKMLDPTTNVVTASFASMFMITQIGILRNKIRKNKAKRRLQNAKIDAPEIEGLENTDGPSLGGR